MKKLLIPFLLFISLNNKVSAELEINMNEYYPISAETIKLTKQGILLGEYDNKYPSTPFNGIYFDETGNFTFKPKVLKSYKITDLDEDANHYFATSYMVINGQQGVFKISKDFSKIENLGLKAAMRRVHQYKNKIYYGGITHGCYVVNKDGTGNAQILGDGYYGPYIDDIKSNSKNVYILSRGLLYKVNYENNSKEQLIFGLRPSSIELDEDRIYFISSNKFYYLSYDNKL